MRREKVTRLLLIILAILGLVCVMLTYKKNCIPSVMTLPFNQVKITEKDGVDILLINSEKDFVDFAESTYHGHDYFGKTVYLYTDLDYNEIVRIADENGKQTSPKDFKGMFDGKGHAINDFVLVTSFNSGLFTHLMGTIANLQIPDGMVQGELAGAFADIAENAKFINCCAYVDIAGGTVLGLYGGGEATVENCVTNYNYTTVNAQILNKKMPQLNRDFRTHVDGFVLWEMDDEGKPVFSTEFSPERIVMDYDNGRSLEVFYSTEEYKYICPVPNGFNPKNAVPTVRYIYEDRSVEYPLAMVDGSYWLDWGDNIFEVEIVEGGEVPSLMIELGEYEAYESMIESKFVEFNGTARLYDEYGKQLLREGVKKMHSRGHSSFENTEKVGYAIEFAREVDLFGMGADLHWIVLPAARDSSFLTYLVYQDLAKVVGFEKTPEQTPIHLYINGKYAGMYILSERIEIEDGRYELSNAITLNNERSFIIEQFNRKQEDETPYVFLGTNTGRYILRYPKEATKSQQDAIIDYVKRTEDAIELRGEPDKYGKTFTDYIDLESYTKQWLMLYLGAEKSIASSIYFYRDIDSHGDQKIHAIKPWDVEHSYCPEYIDVSKDEYYDLEKGMDMYNMGMTNHKTKNYPQYMYCLYDNDIFLKEARKHWEEKFLPAVKAALDPETGYVEDGLSAIDYYVEKYKTAYDLNTRVYHGDLDGKADTIKQFFDRRADMITEELREVER